MKKTMRSLNMKRKEILLIKIYEMTLFFKKTKNLINPSIIVNDAMIEKVSILENYKNVAIKSAGNAYNL